MSCGRDSLNSIHSHSARPADEIATNAGARLVHSASAMAPMNDVSESAHAWRTVEVSMYTCPLGHTRGPSAGRGELQKSTAQRREESVLYGTLHSVQAAMQAAMQAAIQAAMQAAVQAAMQEAWLVSCTRLDV